MSTYYRLYVRYYQYNDGSGNNGTFSRAVNFDSEAEAIRVRDAIAKAIEAGGGRASVGMEDSDSDLPDYTRGCCGGFYKSVQLFKVDEAMSPLGSRVA